ncbi:hypothetical protein ACOME3_005489 [Neoechinorhynchus agilis]
MYLLAKVHKNPIEARPIIAAHSSYNYKLSKKLCGCVKQLLPPSDHVVTSGVDFIDRLGKISELNLMVSAYVRALFSKIPVEEVIELATSLLVEKCTEWKISAFNCRQPLQFCTKYSNVQFEGVNYDQLDGLAMGSPLSPVLAEL